MGERGGELADRGQVLGPRQRALECVLGVEQAHEQRRQGDHGEGGQGRGGEQAAADVGQDGEELGTRLDAEDADHAAVRRRARGPDR